MDISTNVSGYLIWDLWMNEWLDDMMTCVIMYYMYYIVLSFVNLTYVYFWHCHFAFTSFHQLHLSVKSRWGPRQQHGQLLSCLISQRQHRPPAVASSSGQSWSFMHPKRSFISEHQQGIPVSDNTNIRDNKRTSLVISTLLPSKKAQRLGKALKGFFT